MSAEDRIVLPAQCFILIVGLVSGDVAGSQAMAQPRTCLSIFYPVCRIICFGPWWEVDFQCSGPGFQPESSLRPLKLVKLY